MVKKTLLLINTREIAEPGNLTNKNVQKYRFAAEKSRGTILALTIEMDLNTEHQLQQQEQGQQGLGFGNFWLQEEHHLPHARQETKVCNSYPNCNSYPSGKRGMGKLSVHSGRLLTLSVPLLLLLLF